MMMKVTILGCGSSGGVPLIGNNWGACNPSNPRNRRTRASILVEKNGTSVLIDTPPDTRQQLLSFNLKHLDAVLYTHAHADHSHGIDELRSVNWLIQKPVDIYADPMTMGDLVNRFGYIFHGSTKGMFYTPAVIPHEVQGTFSIKNMSITPFFQNHGTIRTLGFRIGDFAYSTDVHDFDNEALEVLKGIRTWVLDCVREREHPTHLNVEQAVAWINQVKPEQAFLTHMNHETDYDTLSAKLPAHIRPAYDGLVIECS
ncbi:MAG: MBL fold metallo-hydrolase [Alphaproteobacteria bacterium]|nr:MBL fold metallo-hydrolase [Alphaproteobacteria bacterium]